MRLAIFDDHRLGVVDPAGAIVDVTGVVPGHDGDPFGAGWWVRLVRDLDELRPRLEEAAAAGQARPVEEVRLRSPALNPGKVVAAACNYREHRDEVAGIYPRLGQATELSWLLKFGVFLKAPTSLVGDGDAVCIPALVLADKTEVHHESELAVIVGRTCRDVQERDALAHVAGYTIGLDITVRADGDRSHRKSFDTFTPLGPWLVTTDEIADPQRLRIRLEVDGEVRQDVSTADMEQGVATIIAYASRAMTLESGDVVLTGAPPGVGPLWPGDTLVTTIEGIGTLRNTVILDERRTEGTLPEASRPPPPDHPG